MGKKIRIAHISFHYEPVVGGQEIYIQNLINIFAATGAVNTVYQPVNKHYHYFTKRKNPAVKLVFYLPFLGRLWPKSSIYLFNFFLLSRFFDFLKEDLIIVHYAFHAVPFWFFKKKVIVLSHGVEWYLEDQSLNDRIHDVIARAALDRFKLVANDTHYFRTLGVPAAPAQDFFSQIRPNQWFIPNCVDTNAFRKGEGVPSLKGKKIVLVPRQITKDRGILLAIRAFHEFHKTYDDWHLLIIGPIREVSYKEACVELIAELGLAESVTWDHGVNNQEIPAYYSSSMMTVIPSLRREGTSLSALESMACQCPTVTTNIGGLADLPAIQSDPDPVQLGEKMKYVAEHRDAVIKEQYNAISAIFNYNNWAKAWLEAAGLAGSAEMSGHQGV